MFALIRALPLADVLTRQVPALAVSIVIAETFYEFHSFTLECLAFLATWFVVDATVEGVAGGLARITARSRATERE